ncbi:hypothetical protein COCCADRAFT_29064 [Bipolaris zeicola 26-R-13]|uniref:Uncharacterized protein n=1 Tax=Cochliobolus carbonum (strain 26-R-13) TaxID=930089 RepID=W6YFG0_COCC2|nr:uncharacterized protein COCCADRAFT_29064 [Bipolaris zeicola 26-R-13]EUC29971.1 hypothetical protein COCCADRAFT_29064 [Bipolaris zeicola 26-R-13]
MSTIAVSAKVLRAVFSSTATSTVCSKTAKTSAKPHAENFLDRSRPTITSSFTQSSEVGCKHRNRQLLVFISITTKDRLGVITLWKKATIRLTGCTYSSKSQDSLPGRASSPSVPRLLFVSVFPYPQQHVHMVTMQKIGYHSLSTEDLRKKSIFVM